MNPSLAKIDLLCHKGRVKIPQLTATLGLIVLTIATSLPAHAMGPEPKSDAPPTTIDQIIAYLDQRPGMDEVLGPFKEDLIAAKRIACARPTTTTAFTQSD